MHVFVFVFHLFPLKTGIIPTHWEVKKRKLAYLERVSKRQDFTYSHLGKALHTAIEKRTLEKATMCSRGHTPRAVCSMPYIKARITASESSRNTTYRALNTGLTQPAVYECVSVPEYLQTAFTRIRLSSRYLRIETGRWSRFLRDARLCICRKRRTRPAPVCSHTVA